MASVGSAAAEVLRRSCEATQPIVRLKTRVSTSWGEIPTLTAQLDGVEEPENFVLFSGHIDSWHRGAMDNGSANALMLEVLRVLLPHRGSLRRSLRLAFWSGHSHGRYAGSTWYADNFWEDLNKNCVLHLNTDSPGGRGATVVTEGQAMAETKGVAADVVHELTGEEFNGSRFGRSGDQSFMSLGVPSLFMFVSEQPAGQDASAGDVVALLSGPGAKGGGVGWWWHTTEDTPDKLDPELLVRDAGIYAVCAHRFLSDPVPPLDVHAAAGELLGHLREWGERAGGRFDLSGPVARAEEVEHLAERFTKRLATAEGKEARRLNEALMRAERCLVRQNYAAADPYGQDPAVAQPPVPLLAPVNRLLGAERRSDEEAELLILLVRRRNRLMHELAETARELRRGLED
jgi:Peptidase family M28